MSSNLWSDEDRLFMPRRLGLGYTLNFKYIAKKLGWIKPAVRKDAPDEGDAEQQDVAETPEERLRRSIDDSRFEDR